MDANDVVLKDEERQKCEIWTRVMGYHRPVSEFNKGKKSEYYSRKTFTESNALKHMDDEPCSCVMMPLAAE